ncbi:MAG TPA: 30S ribosomal protein S7 [Firmicutes bacterium]|jgi:small subunit ribosomal protein S7|nr:30S ribosomal protein S7 [Bacillota bacterium]
MPRRGHTPKRHVTPDPYFGSELVAKCINQIMLDGKKSLSERIFFDAMEIVREKTGKEPLDVFEQALKKIMPVVEVRPRRVGGATYQVPVEVRPERRLTLGLRWLTNYARNRSERTMAERLAGEILDAINDQGGAFKKREETHRMAEANRAFAHFRW